MFNNAMMKQAKKMQEKMKETQDIIKKIEVEGVSGGNAVKLSLNGDGELKSIFISDNLMKENKEILEDLIVAAHTDAKEKLKKKHLKNYLRLQGAWNCHLDLNFLFNK